MLFRSGRTVVKLGPGNYSNCAILDNDQLKCWGRNEVGQLGYGDTVDRGDNANEMGDNLPYVDLGSGRTAVDIVGGRFHNCVILDNQEVKCWGRNDEGQLGVGHVSDIGDGPNEMGDNLASVDLGTGRTALSLSSGRRHNCALLDNQKLKCWGDNAYGSLGLGHISDQGDDPGEMGDNLPYVDLGAGRTALKISSGASHTCALLDNNLVKCWGRNQWGQLGLEDTSDRGDNANEMGNNLPYVDLGTGRTALDIWSAGLWTCAKLDNYEVKCWGINDYGMLGYGDTSNRGDDNNEMGDSLPYVNLLGP